MIKNKIHLKIGFSVIIAYIFITGVLFFGFNHPTADSYLKEMSPERFWGEDYKGEKVSLIEAGDDALKIRLDWIAQAEDSIDLTFHSLHRGEITDIILASLVEAADRGVQVRILLDGIFHGLHFSYYNLRYLLQFHPNIEYRLYEPLKLLQPWTWNNRLHDKLMIVDQKVALISGRNLGDRFYMPPTKSNNIAIDLDLVLFNLDQEAPSTSGITQILEYFQLLWEHPFTAVQQLKATPRRQQGAEKQQRKLYEKLSKARTKHPELFVDTNQWLIENSLPVKQITLIHNPIQRGNKEPWIWAELVRLAELAQTSLVVQSPYVIPTKAMLKYIDNQKVTDKEIILMTNSLAVSPNLLAIAGYKGKKNFIENNVSQIWEYLGPGSLHGKALAIDHELSVVGSFNIDARSAFLSTETMLVIHSEELNQWLRQAIKDKTATCHLIPATAANLEYQLPKASWYKRLGVRMLRPLVLIFDFLL